MKGDTNWALSGHLRPGHTQDVSKNRAFTLVELMAVIGIITLLVVLGVPAWKKSLQSADRATASSQMRQIGMALFQYTGEQNGTLPGPMKVGQGAKYQMGENDRLAAVLEPYLGLPEASAENFSKIFLPPAFVRALGADNAKMANAFVMNISAKDARDQPLKPWGNDVGQNKAGPMKIHAVPPTVWAFCDADQINPLVVGQPWAGKTPKTIVNGGDRLALFFDGSVAGVSEATLNRSQPPGPPKPPPPPR